MHIFSIINKFFDMHEVKWTPLRLLLFIYTLFKKTLFIRLHTVKAQRYQIVKYFTVIHHKFNTVRSIEKVRYRAVNIIRFSSVKSTVFQILRSTVIITVNDWHQSCRYLTVKVTCFFKECTERGTRYGIVRIMSIQFSNKMWLHSKQTRVNWVSIVHVLYIPTQQMAW